MKTKQLLLTSALSLLALFSLTACGGGTTNEPEEPDLKVDAQMLNGDWECMEVVDVGSSSWTPVAESKNPMHYMFQFYFPDISEGSTTVGEGHFTDLTSDYLPPEVEYAPSYTDGRLGFVLNGAELSMEGVLITWDGWSGEVINEQQVSWKYTIKKLTDDELEMWRSDGYKARFERYEYQKELK